MPCNLTEMLSLDRFLWSINTSVHPWPDTPIISQYLRTKGATSFCMSIKLSHNDRSYIYFIFESFSLSFTSLANGSIHHIHNIIWLLGRKKEGFFPAFLMFVDVLHSATEVLAIHFYEQYYLRTAWKCYIMICKKCSYTQSIKNVQYMVLKFCSSYVLNDFR